MKRSRKGIIEKGFYSNPVGVRFVPGLLFLEHKTVEGKQGIFTYGRPMREWGSPSRRGVGRDGPGDFFFSFLFWNF